MRRSRPVVINGCLLFWKEKEKLEIYTVCKELSGSKTWVGLMSHLKKRKGNR
jgi:hypothetical protein